MTGFGRTLRLDRIKGHLLGRDETDVVSELSDMYEGNVQVEFEPVL